VGLRHPPNNQYDEKAMIWLSSIVFDGTTPPDGHSQ
jgi:hypothetical protein